MACSSCVYPDAGPIGFTPESVTDLNAVLFVLASCLHGEATTTFCDHVKAAISPDSDQKARYQAGVALAKALPSFERVQFASNRAKATFAGYCATEVLDAMRRASLAIETDAVSSATGSDEATADTASGASSSSNSSGSSGNSQQHDYSSLTNAAPDRESFTDRDGYNYFCRTLRRNSQSKSLWRLVEVYRKAGELLTASSSRGIVFTFLSAAERVVSAAAVHKQSRVGALLAQLDDAELPRRFRDAIGTLYKAFRADGDPAVWSGCGLNCPPVHATHLSAATVTVRLPSVAQASSAVSASMRRKEDASTSDRDRAALAAFEPASADLADTGGPRQSLATGSADSSSHEFSPAAGDHDTMRHILDDLVAGKLWFPAPLNNIRVRRVQLSDLNRLQPIALDVPAGGYAWLEQPSSAKAKMLLEHASSPVTIVPDFVISNDGGRDDVQLPLRVFLTARQ